MKQIVFALMIIGLITVPVFAADELQLKDEKGEVLTVEYRGVIPGNFDQATSIVAIGRYDDGRFRAEQLLVKCPSKYQAEAEKAKGAA